MSNVENESAIKWIVSDLIQAIKTEEQLKLFYSLLPVGLCQAPEPLKSPCSPSVKGEEERIDRQVKRTAHQFRHLVSSQQDWANEAVWDALGVPPGHACRYRPVVTMPDVCSEVPATPLRATAEYWRGYRAGARAQGGCGC